MFFCRKEIAAAIRLRDLALEWHPRPGLYIWDEKRRIGPSSPFQRGVYFLLDVDCFTDYFGGIEQLKQAVVWLPTWEQCRVLLSQKQISCNEIADRIYDNGHPELLTLYGMLEECLKQDRNVPS